MAKLKNVDMKAVAEQIKLEAENPVQDRVPLEKLKEGKASKPKVEKEPKLKKAVVRGKTLTLAEENIAFEKHSARICLEWFNATNERVKRAFPEDEIDQKWFNPAFVDAWFEPLLTVHTFSHTHGDVVTGFLDETGKRVPFTSLIHFLCAQQDHCELHEKRFEDWNKMYLMGLKNNDGNWFDQYHRQTKNYHRGDKRNVIDSSDKELP